MNVGRSALQLVELIQSNAVPRTVVQDRPDVLALFHSSGGTAEKMSADRSNVIEVVTRAADTSDRAVEAIHTGRVRANGQL